MNKRSLQLHCLGLAVLGLLSACGGGGGGGGGSAAVSAGTIQLGASVYDGSEGTAVNIFVNRSGGNSGSASVDYEITDGTAIRGSDYSISSGARTGTITFADQASGNQTITVGLTDDNVTEGRESFTITLSNVSGATLGARSSATINIIDNDTAAVSAFGPITELNSVTVNGIRYNTTATDVNINGLSASISDLELGQIVAIEGDVNFSNARGTADRIDYSATVIGPVENIDATLDRLIVMGQTVLINADTAIAASIDPNTFTGLALGATAQICGFLNADGDIVATRIEPDTTSTGVQLVGAVAGLDPANMLFSVNRLTVDYSNAVLIDLPAGMPANGMLVMVRGSLMNGILVVNDIASIVNMAAAPGERAHAAGIVTRFVSPADFDLNGYPLRTDANTDFVNGNVGDLQVNVEITVDGEVVIGGDTVLAHEITIGRPVDDTSTDMFDFENFTNISVLGFSKVTVEQGSDYSVEVTAPAAIFGNVEVTQDGDTIILGDNDSLFLNAVVTMPVLNRIDVEAGSIANVLVRDFDQTQMTVNVGGVSRLHGEGLQIGDLTASVSGVSLLDFGGIRPIGTADVDVNGVSQATLNMQVGSTLTGSVRTGQGTGYSTLFYYGTNAAVNVTTDSLSRLVRLGDTRP